MLHDLLMVAQTSVVINTKQLIEFGKDFGVTVQSWQFILAANSEHEHQ